LISIRSGGQTGVDRAALDVAIGLGMPYCGWCPQGGWAEDAPTPPGIRARYPLLVETPSADPRQRSAWNVRDSNATIILLNDGWSDSAGTEFTRLCAELIFPRPFFVGRIAERGVVTQAQRWLSKLDDATAATFNLNVAGPRESESSGITAAASQFLREFLSVTGRR
jgi:hypothetical protein